MYIETVCPICKKKSCIIVTARDYMAWKNGEGLIQNLMPYLTSDEREKLMTGYCEECWQDLFKNEEEW